MKLITTCPSIEKTVPLSAPCMWAYDRKRVGMSFCKAHREHTLAVHKADSRVCVAGFGGIFLRVRQKSDPVTITVSSAAHDSGHVRFEVHNRTRRAMMLGSLDLLGRVGTNWAFGGHIPLGDAKTNFEILSLEVAAPIGRKEWKARLVYEPQAAGFKLLKWRLQEAWRTRSLAQGFRLTGWDASQYAYSEALHQ